MLAQLLVIGSMLLGGGAPVQWLPDLIVDPAAFADRSIDSNAIPGRLVLRFRSSIPNIGLGEFRIVSTGEGTGDGIHTTVAQVVQWSDFNTNAVLLNDHVLYNTATLHMDVKWWVRYRIRELLPGNGVGPVLAHGAKPSINVTSSTAYDTTLPNAPAPGDRLFGSGPIQGISVGYTDIYPKSLPLQWVDISHLPAGDYWLEMEVDAGNGIQESDDTNNIARAIINLSHANLPPFLTHMADTDISLDFNLAELLRVVQLYNSFGYYCLGNTEDGFQPGAGDDETCLPHSSDYAPQDWVINLGELLRMIQLFNLGAYTECPEAEDGYCSGVN